MSDAPTQAGLNKVDALAPGTGFFDASLVARGVLGGRLEAVARAEVGKRLTAAVSAFGFAEAVLGPLGAGFQGGVGVRGTF